MKINIFQQNKAQHKCHVFSFKQNCRFKKLFLKLMILFIYLFLVVQGCRCMAFSSYREQGLLSFRYDHSGFVVEHEL